MSEHLKIADGSGAQGMTGIGVHPTARSDMLDLITLVIVRPADTADMTDMTEMTVMTDTTGTIGTMTRILITITDASTTPTTTIANTIVDDNARQIYFSIHSFDDIRDDDRTRARV
jgi:hypothetical protein